MLRVCLSFDHDTSNFHRINQIIKIGFQSEHSGFSRAQIEYQASCLICYFLYFFSRAGDLKHHERYSSDMLTLWCTNELWMGIFLYKLYFASLLFPFHFSSISESPQLSVVEERRKTDGCAGVLYDELRGIGSGWNVVEWQKLELILLDGFLISLLRFLCFA